jgi:uncharacterized protein YndB with AHSA1/START domain
MSVANRGPRAVADVSVGMIIATVDIRVPPERVFAALSTDEVVAWWGDEAMYHTTSWHSDVRVGGSWRAGGVAADGTPYAVHGEYLEVDPPRKLVQTWQPDWDKGRATQLTYLLEPIEGGTRLTVRHEGFGQDQHESCRDHGDGWERVLGWLRQYAGGAAADGAGKFYLFRLIPPRPTFAFDMSEHERSVMSRHAAYWLDKLEAGLVVVFGPVNDPAGPWGLCVLRVKGDDEMAALREGDPAIREGIGMRYETLPMISAVARQ